MRYIHSLLMLFLFATRVVAEDDMYTVRDVTVDVQAASAVAAEQKAMQEARAKAFQMLVERLVPEDQRGGLDQVPADKLEDMVSSFEVNNNKNSKVRYIATMTFYFDGNAVQNYLHNRTITPVQATKQPLVVVPIFIDQGGILLWGEQNPWLQAWAQREKFSAVAPIVVPFGDLKDISTIDGRQIISGEISALGELARRYGAAGVIVATMRRDSGNPMSPMSYEASLVSLDGQVLPLSQTRVNANQGSPVLQFDQAIDSIVKQLENNAQEESKMIQTSMAPNQLLARIPLDSPRAWQMIQANLKGCGEIADMTVKGLARRQATVVITYRGTPAMLESSLGARGLQLEQLDGQSWVIRSVQPQTSSPY